MTFVWAILLSIIALAIGLRLYDHINGESFVLDRWDAWRIRKSALAELDRRCASASERSDIIVSLSTIPSRLPHIATTLKSLLRQERLPKEIHVNIPAFSRRENCAYEIPEWLSSLAAVRVVRCEDHGPATKFLPTLLREAADRKILVVDDDRIYPPTLIADLEKAAQENPESAPCACGWIVPADLVDAPTNFSYFRSQPGTPILGVHLSKRKQVDVLKGVGGYLVRPRFFDLEALADYSAAPPEAFYVDDIWISAHCRTPKFVVPTRRMDFHPHDMRGFYRSTSLGQLDRDKARNTAVLKYFGAARWPVGAGGVS